MPVFKVNSGEIRISDPCYDKDDYMCGVVIPARSGEWVASAETENCGVWGERVVNLVAEYNGFFVGGLTPTTHQICVDSGQAGIFDFRSYKNDNSVKDVKRVHDEIICENEPWYSICCDRTLSKKQWGVIPNGVISSSGYGDGCYEVTCFVDKDGLAARVEIVFISDDDEEDYEDYEDENF